MKKNKNFKALNSMKEKMDKRSQDIQELKAEQRELLDSFEYSKKVIIGGARSTGKTIPAWASIWNNYNAIAELKTASDEIVEKINKQEMESFEKEWEES